ncbi:carbon-nitrogen hydrolase family protein [Pseudozobellia thermophila]|uniref:Predicted amidohydrolase n=1 Tax=Pseudozobellia thermophila TaxID=192903 RepID=A0A1M6F1B7_9FLAO|nr:carbon-nitrogen hydrolase family protein [Pseudozobellia thermophila]SHI91455.1 Predicted amidohydrolase [Pseudozobellia thermophila]
MKIALAQIHPTKGNYKENIALHTCAIRAAIEENTNAIFFPELSLTGYEPALAEGLKIGIGDESLQAFGQIGSSNNIVIALGVPLQEKGGVSISMLLFQPQRPVARYSKQFLHDDERPYFTAGDAPGILRLQDKKIALAICYESLQERHLEQNISLGADMYLASVAKSQKGIDRACSYFPEKSRLHQLPILMVNAVGPCDNFESAGQSSVWNSEGRLVGQLTPKEQSLLIYDTSRGSTTVKPLPLT